MSRKPAWSTLFAIFCIAFNAHGQSVPADSLFKKGAAGYVVDFYHSAIGDQSEIYSGAEYKLYPPANNGSAYFQEAISATSAVICYNGTWYKNIPVLYDMYADIMAAALRDSLYILRPEKVSDVYLLNHHFINLNKTNAANLSPGFYDQLYNSTTTVLVKRVRTIRNTVTQRTVEVSYDDKDIIYVKKGNVWYRVSSKASVLNVFNDKKKQLKHYMGDNFIKYNDDKEGSIVKLTRYYDQITN
jgi:hypothetical protein